MSISGDYTKITKAVEAFKEAGETQVVELENGATFVVTAKQSGQHEITVKKAEKRPK